ncbi:MAG: TetR/AcrR family transcriptional regulator C-terminal ligand-binding domain-containing protein, partial [Iamia sp.]
MTDATAGPGPWSGRVDRWASKEALLFDAVATVADEPPSPDTGSVRADLLALFAPAVERFADDLAGRLLVEMAAAAAQDVALREVQRHL